MSANHGEDEKIEAYTRALMEAARSEGRSNSDLVQWQHAKKFSPEVLETLSAMHQDDDLDIIDKVAKHYKELLDSEDTTVSVTVTTAVQTRDNAVRPCRFRVRLTGDGDRTLDVPVTVGMDGRVSAPATYSIAK